MHLEGEAQMARAGHANAGAPPTDGTESVASIRERKLRERGLVRD